MYYVRSTRSWRVLRTAASVRRRRPCRFSRTRYPLERAGVAQPYAGLGQAQVKPHVHAGSHHLRQSHNRERTRGEHGMEIDDERTPGELYGLVALRTGHNGPRMGRGRRDLSGGGDKYCFPVRGFWL